MAAQQCEGWQPCLPGNEHVLPWLQKLGDLPSGRMEPSQPSEPDTESVEASFEGIS